MYQDGQLKEDNKVIHAKMDQMYIKLEGVTDAEVINVVIFLQYWIDPPYIKNFNSASTLMYPVLKGNAAWGGNISK